MAQSELWSVLGNGPAAVLVAALVVGLTVAAGTRYRLGPDSDWVEVARAVFLPVLDPVIERVVGGVGSTYELSERELVGVIDAGPEGVETLLWEAGCRRNVLSASKTLPDGRRQIGAWVIRDPAVVGTKMQVDIMLFEAETGTLVAAHREFSSALRWLFEDPEVLVDHYEGTTYDPEAGERLVREAILPNVEFE